MSRKQREQRRQRWRRSHGFQSWHPEDWGVLACGPFPPAIDAEQLRRERNKARELRASQWWKRKRAAGICHYCGGKFRPQELTMDHLVPLARGGKSTKGNLVPACKACNTKKKYLLAFEFEAASR